MDDKDISRKRTVLAAVAAGVTLLTVAVFLLTLRNGLLIWDDEYYVVNNLHIRSFNRDFLSWAFSNIDMSLWYPLTWISYAVDYALWGLNPAGYHLTSVLFHGANTALVVYMAVGLIEVANRSRREARRPGLLDDRGILIAGGATGLLFGLHPLHVESVAWASGRVDLICTLFLLVSVVSYSRYAAKRGSGAARWAPFAFVVNKWYLLSLAGFVLALFSKPAAVVFPAVLLLLDWFPYERFRSRKDLVAAVVDKLPFAIGSAIIAAVTLWAQRTIGTMASLDSAPLAERFLVAAEALVAYLGKMVLPLHLMPYYPYPHDVSVTSASYLGAALLVIGITAACVATSRMQRGLSAAWIYYLVVLFPVLGFIKVRGVSMADRYTYLSSLGPFLLMGVGAALIWMWASGRKERRALVRRVAAAGGLVVVLALSVLTIRQIAVWKDSITFWTYIIEEGPYRIPLAFNNRGIAFTARGQYDEAIGDLSAAISLDPNYDLAYYNRGKAYAAKGLNAEALADYQRATELRPEYADPYVARGRLYTVLGQYGPAIDDFNKAIALDPQLADAYAGRGAVFKELGRPGMALTDYNAAIELSPADPVAYIYRGILFKDLRKFDKAIADYTKAISLRPSSAEAYNNLGVAYKHLGEVDSAIANFTRAIDINPSFALAYCNRGIAFGMMGEKREAIADYSRALSLQPDMIKALVERGKLYRERGEKDQAKADFQKACSLGDPEACAAARLK